MKEKNCFSNTTQQDTIVKPQANSDTLTVNKINFSNQIKHTTDKEIKQTIKIVTLPRDHNDSLANNSLFLNVDITDNSLINNYKSNIWFRSTKDSSCYIVDKENDNNFKPTIIIEKVEKNIHFEKEFVIKEKPNISSDWTIFPILGGLFLLAVIFSRYRKYLGLILESVVHRFSSHKILNEKNSQFQRMNVVLDILFVISFALAIDQIVKGLGFYSAPDKFQFIVFVAFGSLLIALRLFRLIVFKLSALLSNHQPFFKDLFNNASLYTRAMGIFLLPMVFLITYSTGLINIFFIYLAVFTIFIMLILRTINMFRAFIVGGFSIFYFILYLCALEIVPLLVIWKEVKSR